MALIRMAEATTATRRPGQRLCALASEGEVRGCWPHGELCRVEEVQDAVEQVLMAAGIIEVERAYVRQRNRHAELRHAKAILGVRDDLELAVGAVAVLKERYLRRGPQGDPVESPGEMLDRAASHVALAEERFAAGSATRWAEEFSTAMRALEFLPNSPTLMNAGTSLGLLSGCVVLPLEDSLDSIFQTLRQAALVHQAGGGTGFSLSRLRPRGEPVAGGEMTASGPVSFLPLFDAAAEVVSEAGRRRGACMAVLDISHPDIEEFIEAKESPGVLDHFNTSVGVSDKFMRALQRGGHHYLVNPRTGKVAGRVEASELFARVCAAAWKGGDPGLLFLDRINRDNPLPSRGCIEATNPCGEVPLLPFESCNLGSLNLARFVAAGKVDFPRLGRAVSLAVRFLDDVIDASRYPFGELERQAQATRKIGLGVMGLAEMLAMLSIPYNSSDAVRLASRVMAFIQGEAREASARLALERGPFPLFEQSCFAGCGVGPLRNAQLTSVAPTGTISLIAGTTSGVEPMFALSYVRHLLGRDFAETNPLFERIARRRGFYSERLMADIARTGTCQTPEVPADVRAAFVTALDIPASWHLKMQAAIQRHVDAAVAKTINLPSEASIADVRRIFLAAWQAKVKGITVYRYGARTGQVFSVGPPDGVPGARVVVADSYSGGCASRTCDF